MAYAMVRTDSLSGITDASLLTHGRYVNASGAYAEIENGSIVLVGALETGERESRQYKDITSSTGINAVALIANPELMKHNCEKKSLSDYVNAAGQCIRGYMFHKNDVFSVSAQAFDGTVPTKSQKVSVAANAHKMKAGTTGALTIGECIDIEIKKGVTWYVIKVEGVVD